MTTEYMNTELNQTSLLSFLQSSGPVGKNDIADAFGIKGDVRIALKDLLRTLEDSGLIIKLPGQLYSVPNGLPDMAPLQIVDVTLDGELFAEPIDWDVERQGVRPRVIVQADSKDHATLTTGDQILARIRKTDDETYEARIMRRLSGGATTIIGQIVKTNTGYAVRTLAKRNSDMFDIAEVDLNAAAPHTIVKAELTSARGPATTRVRVTEILGTAGDPKIISLVAAHESGLSLTFPDTVVKESEKLTRPVLEGKRIDLRHIPLVTIDGEDARDFDDAVFAEPDLDPENHGGFHLIVAIADVAYYVRQGTALDKEAFKRGNSTYFPDRVIPMLPEAISNDLCSLRPKEDRHCLAVHMWIDKDGVMKKHKFMRGLMKSIARLTYNQVQAAYDGRPDAMTEILVRPVIFPLYEAYKILLKARKNRGTLEIDVPERKILIDESGAMSGLALRERFDSHKLIEEFMVLANVAAALALQAKKAPCVYRVHDVPSFEKMDNLRTYLSTFGIQIPKGSVDEPAQLSEILNKAKGKPFAPLVSESMLRSQMQAHYSPDNIGHFGLALNHYAHFTSPIRRYADLVVHRSLIAAYGLGDGGLAPEDVQKLGDTCEHISITERASMEAERSSVDRFSAAYMADKVGATFTATIGSVTRFGLFVRLTETGADGLVPIRLLDNDYYIHDERLHALIGRRSNRIYRLGAQMRVELLEVEPLAGAMLFRPADELSADIPGYELDPSMFSRDDGRRDDRRGGFNKARGRDDRGSSRKGPPGRGPKGHPSKRR
jgi:ribonuclease R